ncbi:MAG: class I tRNA ligase family protein, partial [Steroidobacteraceae bacterium]|nr:class I tRNA ligase family protein [Steroidobacteraceae bacterium]
WFDLEPRELLGDEAEHYEKVTDVMDVWADSGLSFECVGAQRPEIAAPVDLYLEGSDQHRGWFHSSLLLSEAIYGRAPYKAVLTHGFTVDERGRKMSKSLGNVVAPQRVVETLGADVLRLWVAATDYANEMAVSDEILKRMADAYRRLRNTLRFLLGNLADFDPARDLVAPPQLLSFDAWILRRAAALQAEIAAAYREYEFHSVYQKVHNFCVVDLGGLYLDVIKDRLYTTGVASRARRSAQTATWHLAQAMVRWLAPILSFTCEEAWRYLPGRRLDSVFFATWHELPDVTAVGASIDWPFLLELRSAVARELEVLRAAGAIGSALEAEIDIYAAAQRLPALRALDDELRFLLITSRATVHDASGQPSPGGARPSGIEGVEIIARPTTAPKCVRCWHRTPDVGSQRSHPQLCARCVSNVEGPGEVRRHV